MRRFRALRIRAVRKRERGDISHAKAEQAPGSQGRRHAGRRDGDEPHRDGRQERRRDEGRYERPQAGQAEARPRALRARIRPDLFGQPEDRRGRAGRQGNEVDGRRRRDRDQRIDLRRGDPGAADDLPRGRLYRTHAEEFARQRDGSQYRLPCLDRRARRRRPHSGRAGPAGGAALEGGEARHLHLSLRPGRHHDPLSRGVRHERGGDGAAQGRAQGPQRQGAAL